MKKIISILLLVFVLSTTVVLAERTFRPNRAIYIPLTSKDPTTWTPTGNYYWGLYGQLYLNPNNRFYVSAVRLMRWTDYTLIYYGKLNVEEHNCNITGYNSDFDDKISKKELDVAIIDWKKGDIGMNELMKLIGYYKAGQCIVKTDYNDIWNYITCLGTAKTDSRGMFWLTGNYDYKPFLNDGKDQKFRIVPSNDIDCEEGKMMVWNPSNYLFEHWTI